MCKINVVVGFLMMITKTKCFDFYLEGLDYSESSEPPDTTTLSTTSSVELVMPGAVASAETAPWHDDGRPGPTPGTMDALKPESVEIAMPTLPRVDSSEPGQLGSSDSDETEQYLRAPAKDQYQYVVVLDYQGRPRGMARGTPCSGSLVGARWALTAARCLAPPPRRLRHGTQPGNDTNIYTKVLNTFPHPSYFNAEGQLRNDIGLVLVEKVALDSYGRVSAMDYRTLSGLPVVYVSVGSEKGSLTRQGGPGAAMACGRPAGRRAAQPVLCVVRPCRKKLQRSPPPDQKPPRSPSPEKKSPRSPPPDKRPPRPPPPGEKPPRPPPPGKQPPRSAPPPPAPGAPLLASGQIVGVSVGSLADQLAFTAVSPFLDWIWTLIVIQEKKETQQRKIQEDNAKRKKIKQIINKEYFDGRRTYHRSGPPKQRNILYPVKSYYLLK